MAHGLPKAENYYKRLLLTISFLIRVYADFQFNLAHELLNMVYLSRIVCVMVKDTDLEYKSKFISNIINIEK